MMNDLLSLDTDDAEQLHPLSPKSPVTMEDDADSVQRSDAASAVMTSADLTLNASRILQAGVGAPVFLLTSNVARGTLEASILLDTASMSAVDGSGPTSPWQSLPLTSLHSLAQASLISDTQEQIAKQLSEVSAESSLERKTAKTSKVANRRDKKKGDAGPEKPSAAGTARTRTTATTKIKFANDLRENLGTHQPRKQIAIFEPQPSEPKTFTCNYKGCGRKFAWQAHYKYHLSAHENDRRHVCETCDKRFLTAQRLNVHMRTHTGEKPFVCPVEDCGKSFTTAGNLKNHSRVHTGERPFACEVDGCGRRFAEYSSLHKHSLTHSGAKPFSCNICGKLFSQSGSCRVHMNKHKLYDGKQVGKQDSACDNDVGMVVEEGIFSPPTIKLEESAGDVLVLCNTSDDVHYQDLQNAESIVFPQGLSDHIVTVTTQPADGETETLELTHDILGAEEVLVEDPMANVGGVSEGGVVVLSQPSHLDPLHSPLSTAYHSMVSSSHHAPDYDHGQLLHEDMSTTHHSLSYPHLDSSSHLDPSSHLDSSSHLDPSSHLDSSSQHDSQVEEMNSSHHPLEYTHLDPSVHHDAQTVAEEIEVGVSSSSHQQSGESIHMDPMMELDDEFEDSLHKAPS